MKIYIKTVDITLGGGYNIGKSYVGALTRQGEEMKKLSVFLVACLMAAVSVFGFAGCSKESKVKVINIELTSEDYVFAVKTGDTATQTALNTFMADLKEEGTFDEIVNSFFDGTSDFTYSNPASKDGCIVVATSADFPPFEYKSGDKFTGIDMQIAYLFAQDQGKQLYIDDIGFDQVILSMGQASSEYTLGMAGITYSEERDESMDFSEPYYTSAQVIIVKEDDATFDGCTSAAEIEEILNQQSSSYKIGTQKGTTGYMYSAGDESFGYPGFTNLETLMYDAGALAVKDLSNGKINAVIIDAMPAKMIAESTNANIG